LTALPSPRRGFNERHTIGVDFIEPIDDEVVCRLTLRETVPREEMLNVRSVGPDLTTPRRRRVD
jgi:hypothetical protein